MRSYRMLQESPTVLLRRGHTPTEVVNMQARYMEQGYSLWDYVSWAYLHGMPLNPIYAGPIAGPIRIPDIPSPKVTHAEPMQPKPEPAMPTAPAVREKVIAPPPTPWLDFGSKPKTEKLSKPAKGYKRKSIHEVLGCREGFDVNRYIQKLTPAKRELIVRYYLHGEQPEAIAASRNLKVHTLRVYISQAMSDLKRIMREAGVMLE